MRKVLDSVRRRRSPAGLSVLGDHCGENPAANVPAGREPQVTWLGGLHHVIGDLVGHGLVKGPLAPKRPHIKFECLQLQVLVVGDVVQSEVGEGGLAGERAQTGELGHLDVHPIIPTGLGIGEGL